MIARNRKQMICYLWFVICLNYCENKITLLFDKPIESIWHYWFSYFQLFLLIFFLLSKILLLLSYKKIPKVLFPFNLIIYLVYENPYVLVSAGSWYCFFLIDSLYRYDMTKQNQVILFLLSTKKLIFMKQYLDLLSDIMEHGIDKSDRTGTGTRSVFGRQLRFDLTKGFPLLTTKKLYTRAIIP